MQDILHAKYIVLDLEYYDNDSYYNSLDRAQAEAPYRPVRIRIVSELAQLGAPERHLSGGRGHACFLPYWLLAAALLLAALPAVFVRLRYSQKLY